MVSEVSVHGDLAPSNWACGEAEHHGGEGIVNRAAHFMEAKEAERERKGVGQVIFPGPQ
jgi:hypothetical protein